MNLTIASLEEIRECGREHGAGIASANYSEFPRIGDNGIENMDDLQESFFELLREAESNCRQYSPFEFTARELNERPDADEAWQEFDEGVQNAFEAAWENHRPCIREYTAEEQFMDVLNETWGTVNIAGYTFEAGNALYKLDYIAFRQGMLVYYDNEGIDIE